MIDKFKRKILEILFKLLIHKTLSECLHKPKRFHYLCYSSSGAKLVDSWGTQEIYKCYYNCYRETNCNQIVKGIKELRRREIAENAGMMKMMKIILDAAKGTR